MSTGPSNDLGLTAKGAAGDGCCGSGACGSDGCGGACGNGAESAGGCGSGGGCACSAPAPTVRTDSVIGAPKLSSAPRRSSTVLEVTGMTRARCIVTVMNALERIPGVNSVDVDLQPGGVSLVTVSSARELDVEAAHAALSSAGYPVAGSPVPVA